LQAPFRLLEEIDRLQIQRNPEGIKYVHVLVAACPTTCNLTWSLEKDITNLLT